LNACDGPWRYALPTQAQWECVARAGSGPLFGAEYGGWRNITDENLNILEKQTWSRENTIEQGKPYPQPVGQLSPNPWGIYDLAGNVHEWCQGRDGRSYWRELDSITDPPGPRSGSYRVCRGKSFYRPLNEMHWYSATGHKPGYRSFEMGFRLVRMRRD
jgi:formylglycine-generating enzyme required for sulfatase activity